MGNSVTAKAISVSTAHLFVTDGSEVLAVPVITRVFLENNQTPSPEAPDTE